MKKAIACFTLTFFVVVLLTGCAAVATAPVSGIYSQVKGPITATTHTKSSKVGSATCTSLLGLIASGDASIETAAKSAGITKISHVDYESTNLLGIYATYTVKVYGE